MGNQNIRNPSLPQGSQENPESNNANENQDKNGSGNSSNNENNAEGNNDGKNSKSKKSKQPKQEEVKLDKIEQLLCDTYQSTDIDFSYKEVLTIKLRVHDAEKYFLQDFNCLIYFNSFVFQQRLNILYENYSNNAEKFLRGNISSSKFAKNFLILVDFDDETEMPQEGYYCGNYEINGEGNIVEAGGGSDNVNVATYSTKIEYESLFTIIFEPLEIPIALFFLMTNHNQKTVSDFFPQLYENIYLNKGNRKFDIMYFLLPNLDFFIRNETYVLYIVNQPNQFDESLDILSNYTPSYSSIFSDAVYTSLYFKEMLNVNYEVNNIFGNHLIDKFLKNIIQPSFVQSVFKFSMDFSDFTDFVVQYEREFEVINNLLNCSNVNTLIFHLDNFQGNEEKIEIMFQTIKKIAIMHDKNVFDKSLLIIKLIVLGDFKKNKNRKGSGVGQDINENENYEKLTLKLSDLLRELIQESFIFSSRERVRKNIVECIYYQKAEREDDKDNKDDIIENDDLNTSHENLNAKLGTKVKFKKEKVFYSYFLTDKHIKKMKKYITKILEDKIKQRKSFKNIFEFLFDKKYYITELNSRSGKDSHFNVERMFYI